jgi:hypothetical protein
LTKVEGEGGASYHPHLSETPHWYGPEPHALARENRGNKLEIAGYGESRNAFFAILHPSKVFLSDTVLVHI